MQFYAVSVSFSQFLPKVKYIYIVKVIKAELPLNYMEEVSAMVSSFLCKHFPWVDWHTSPNLGLDVRLLQS